MVAIRQGQEDSYIFVSLPFPLTSSISGNLGLEFVDQNGFVYYTMHSTTSHPSLESIGWYRDRHEATRSLVGDFLFYCSILFYATK